MTSEKKFVGVVTTNNSKLLLAIDNISSIEQDDRGTTVIMANGSEYTLNTDMAAFEWALAPMVERTDGYKNR